MITQLPNFDSIEIDKIYGVFNAYQKLIFKLKPEMAVLFDFYLSTTVRPISYTFECGSKIIEKRIIQPIDISTINDRRMRKMKDIYKLDLQPIAIGLIKYEDCKIIVQYPYNISANDCPLRFSKGLKQLKEPFYQPVIQEQYMRIGCDSKTTIKPFFGNKIKDLIIQSNRPLLKLRLCSADKYLTQGDPEIYSTIIPYQRDYNLPDSDYFFYVLPIDNYFDKIPDAHIDLESEKNNFIHITAISENTIVYSDGTCRHAIECDL